MKEVQGGRGVKVARAEEEREPKLPATNPLYPTFSDAVKIEYAPGRGRFAVARRDVGVGELLAREEAAVRTMLTLYSCKSCGQLALTPLGGYGGGGAGHLPLLLLPPPLCRTPALQDLQVGS